jgi:hypothetical protein
VADKTIGELPAISTLSDAAMLPVEQNGAAGRIFGSQWKQYAVDTVSSYVTTASNAAQTATNAATTATGKADDAEASALSASGSASTAVAAKDAIVNMTVSASTVAAGNPATVTKTEIGGIVNLAFGLPTGATGSQGIQGPAGPQGVQGPRGDTGTAVAVETSGAYYFHVDNDSESQTYGHLFLTYSGDTAPDFSIPTSGEYAGHLIWTVEE